MGALTLDPVAKWDAATNTPGFTNNVGTSPVTAPPKLPTGGVDSVSGTVEYLARFVTASGTTLSLDGEQFFALSNYTAATEQVGSPHVAFGALSLGFDQPGLAAELFGNVSQVAGFAEIDVVGYDQASGALISEASYGAAVATGMTNDIAGTTQASFAYTASEVQDFAAGVADAQFAYDLATKTANFSTSTTAVAAAAGSVVGTAAGWPNGVPYTLQTLPFDNEAERGPRVVREELPYPRVKSARQVPGWVRRRLAGHALSLSFT